MTEELEYQAFCQHCGSTDVSRDAEVCWDIRQQRWTLKCVQDQGFCSGFCEGETTIIMKELPLKADEAD